MNHYTLIPIAVVAGRFGISVQRATRIARGSAVHLATARLKTRGRPALVLSDDREAARLVLAIRLLRAGVCLGLTRTVLAQIGSPASFRVHGRRVLVDGTGDWQDILTRQVKLPLSLPGRLSTRKPT